MPSSFYDYVDDQLRRALPSGARRIAIDKLLGTAPCRISHAFQSSGINDRSILINVLVLPHSFELTPYHEEQLLKLRDYILAKDCLLVVVYEEEKYGSSGDLGIFVEDTLAVMGPGVIRLRCARDAGYKTYLEYGRKEDLHAILGDLWKGIIAFEGPAVGEQTVLLESMEDQCYKCHRPTRTITGIAFPNLKLSRWDNGDWQYYQQLLAIHELEGKHAQVVKEYVGKLRTGNPAITPVDFRYSHTAQETYFAACCPYCDAIRGDLFVMENRLKYLHDMEGRISGQLQYHPISMEVDYVLLSWLWSGSQTGPHSCDMGWRRRPEMAILDLQQWN